MTASEMRRHNESVLRDLQRGDLVEFNRGIYSHWGVYIGDGEIVHLTGDGNSSQSVFSVSGVRYNKGKVVKEKFMDATAESKARKNNSKDRLFRPLNPDKIVKKASSMVGDIGYNVLWHNCEHFATFCRYGIKWSQQVEGFMQLVHVITGGLLLGGITVLRIVTEQGPQ